MAISALTDADYGRLASVSRLHARGIAQLEWRDLLHEAVQRVLDGSRRWPVDLPFAIFLCGVIRSIAGEARRVQSRTLSGGGVAEDLLASVASDAQDPEQAAIGRDLLASLEGLFAGDKVGAGILQGLLEGHSPSEIQARLQLGQTDYDSARRRMRRRIVGASEILA